MSFVTLNRDCYILLGRQGQVLPLPFSQARLSPELQRTWSKLDSELRDLKKQDRYTKIIGHTLGLLTIAALVSAIVFSFAWFWVLPIVGLIGAGCGIASHTMHSIYHKSLEEQIFDVNTRMNEVRGAWLDEQNQMIRAQTD